MKTKLTITIDEELVPRAKQHAARRGTSLSSLVEEALRSATGEREEFVAKWRGRFKLRESDSARLRYLKQKYLARTD